MDRYPDFATLQRFEKDFSITLSDRQAAMTILAPHGGAIEPHTTEIARLIAGSDYNFAAFNGCKDNNNRDLHLASQRWDEPQGTALVKKSAIVVTVHGCAIREPVIYLGGRDSRLLNLIERHLRRRGLPSIRATGTYRGRHADNICNRGLRGAGAQLEISRPLRDDPTCWPLIAAAVRAAISEFTP